MIRIALLKKILSQQFISSVEVSNIARCSSKAYVVSLSKTH